MRVAVVNGKIYHMVLLVSLLYLINKQDLWYGVVGEICEVADS